MKMKQCSETSAYKIQTPGNYPEENKQVNEKSQRKSNQRPSGLQRSASTSLATAYPSNANKLNTIAFQTIKHRRTTEPVCTTQCLEKSHNPDGCIVLTV
jgi:hypothetical protein